MTLCRDIHWADPSTDSDGNVFYPNIDRSLTVIEALVISSVKRNSYLLFAHMKITSSIESCVTQNYKFHNVNKHTPQVAMFSLEPFSGVVKFIELINEAFITIDINIVKDYYLRGYSAVRNINPDIGIVIGDSFRFQEWKRFMYPPDYNHVYIDTHIYQVFDSFRLGMTVDDHIAQTCKQNLPEVAIAPLSTIVGEWSAALTDCAQWLNGAHTGARYDGTFQDAPYIGSCVGQDNRSSNVFTDEYKQDLRRFVEAQMDAYESGSSQGWFFWNFKTERAPQWNYLLGLQEGWIPADPRRRMYRCVTS